MIKYQKIPILVETKVPGPTSGDGADIFGENIYHHPKVCHAFGIGTKW